MADGDGKPEAPEADVGAPAADVGTSEADIGTPETGADAMIGAVLGGRYRVRSLLGRGGMASVYRADDELLERQVAVKLFEPDGGDARDLRRETSEIRTLASLNHHGLVTVFDANVATSGAKDRAYLVMELVDGPTLRQRIERGPMAPEDVAVMAVELGEALHVVHAAGIVHRDIKPDNVLLSRSAVPGSEFTTKLADFGIAFLGDSTRHTVPGTVLGTAAYLSPEQAHGDAPGPASDIYQLGLVLLECLTGVKAFPGSVVESVSAKLVSDPEIPPDLAPACASLLRAMTSRDPEVRPSAWAVAEAAAALRHVATDQPAADATVRMDAATATISMLPPHAGPVIDNVKPLDAVTQPPDDTLVLDAFDSPPAGHTVLNDVLNDAAFGDPAAVGSSITAPDGTGPRHGRRWHRRPWIAVLVALLVVAVGVVVMIIVNNTTAASTAPVTLPPIGGPLGDHLRQLLGSVTP